MSEQGKVGVVTMQQDGWHRGVRFALFAVLVIAAISVVTVWLFDYYFVPGLALVLVMLYAQTGCELKVELAQEEVERIVRDNKYTCYKDGGWGIGPIPYFFSDKFRIVPDEGGVRLEGGRAILKRIAKALRKAQ